MRRATAAMDPRQLPDSLEGDRTSALPPGAMGEPLPEGHVLGGRYRLDGLLGIGGMGQVYRARDTALERDVAVKLLAGPETADARQRFLREARAAAALNHPHIVAVHDLGEEEGRLFLVMELVAGGNLRESAQVPLASAVEIARQVALGLAHAHGHGLVHRDVKPANVLVQESGERPVVKLADLGLAVSSGGRGGTRLTLEGAIVGTVAYLAPEQALGRAVDGRADLYSLGVVLYELVTGRLPFDGNPIAIISQHLHAPVVPPRSYRPDLDPALDAIILRLLAKDPGQRFATAAELAVALGELMTPSQVGLWRAAVGEPPPGAMLDALVRGRIVGRETELEQLRDLWRRAMQRNGHLALVAGEAGAGKTRLTSELAVYARLGGAVVLGGGCYEYEATTPYLPFVEALRRWVHDVPGFELSRLIGDKAAALARLAPELETRLGPLPVVPPLAPHEERLRLFDHFARWLQALAGTSGVLLVLDDLQWADQGTLQLLHYVLRNLRAEPLLVLAACREEEVGPEHPLSVAFDGLHRERLATRLHLDRLDLDGTAAVLAAMSGQAAVAPGLAAAIYRETEGNPFFIEETMKTLIEQGVIYRQGGEWHRHEEVDIHVPEGVRSLISRRIDRLPAVCRDALHAAAALGKVFRFDELHAVQGGDEGPLLDALEEAVKSQLIGEQPDERFVFTHDKIREVLYDGLGDIRRRRLHRQVGERLLAHYGAARAAAHAQVLAHHFHLGGDHERGLEWALRAAEKAEAVYATNEAIESYGRALECARALGRPIDEGRIERALGDAVNDLGNARTGAAHYERALALATDEAQRLELHVDIGCSYVQIGDPRGLPHLQLAIERLDPATHPLQTANALGGLGRYEHLAGQHRHAVELLERAWAIAEPLADSRTEDRLLSFLAGAHQHLAQYRQSNAWAWRCVERGAALRAPHLETIGLEFLAENEASGRLPLAREYARRELEIAERIQAGSRQTWSEFVTGFVLTNQGHLTEGEAHLEHGLEIARRLGESRIEQILLGMLLVNLVEQGNVERAREIAPPLVPAADSSGMIWLRLEARRTTAYFELHCGDAAQAIALAEESAALLVGSDSAQNPLLRAHIHGAALLRLGRHEEALRVLDAGVAGIQVVELPYLEGVTRRVRASARIERGELAAARADVEAALRIADDVASEIERARVLLVRAALDEREGRAGTADREAARELLTRCDARRDLASLAPAPILKS